MCCLPSPRSSEGQEANDADDAVRNYSPGDDPHSNGLSIFDAVRREGAASVQAGAHVSLNQRNQTGRRFGSIAQIECDQLNPFDFSWRTAVSIMASIRPLQSHILFIGAIRISIAVTTTFRGC